MPLARSRLVVPLALSLLGACSGTEPRSGTGVAGATTSGAAGSASGASGTTGTGGGTTTGAAGDSSPGTAGQTTAGAAGSSTRGAAGVVGGAGTTGTAGSGTAGATGAAGTTGTAGTTGVGGASSVCNPPPPRPINVTGTGVFSLSYNGQPLYPNKDKKPIQGKLLLLPPGIGNRPGAGGFQPFVHPTRLPDFAPN